MSVTRAGVLGVCADDVGLVDGVADAVVSLAARGRLSAASCVTNGPGWPRAAAVLAAAEASLELGLHFNLSEGEPRSAELRAHWPTLPGLARLLVLAHLRRLPIAAIGAEFLAQAEAFTGGIGRAPAFVDGHQHVHALPGIRRVVLDVIATWPGRPAVRNTGRLLGPGADFKRAVIEASGGRALRRDLVARGIPHNRDLLGAYDFAAVDYGRLVRGWLAESTREGSLLFCHPCTAAIDGADDPIAAARRREATYLGSDEFAADLRAAGVTIGAPWAKRSSSGD